MLNAIWGANEAKGGYPVAVTIITQPAALKTLIYGDYGYSILSVETSTANSIDYPFYQWYSSTTNSNTGGTKIQGATHASFQIPQGLAMGAYYYFCEVRLGRSVVRSSVAKIAVTPPISGPSYVCDYEVWYSVSNLPAGITSNQVKWTCSSNLQPYNGNYGPSKQFYVTGEGTGWVKAEITSLNVVSQMNNITLHPYPKPTREEGLSNPGTGHYYYITLPYTPGCNEYEWHASPSGLVTIDDNDGSDAADICFGTDGQVIIYAYAINACGKSPLPDHIYVFAPNYGGYSATYPNPARDILTVDLDAAVNAQQQPAVASRTVTADYDLRLYDGQGNLLRSAKTKGGTVQFNVANLPDGIYYLHIYDGVNPKPEIQQIAVEH